VTTCKGRDLVVVGVAMLGVLLAAAAVDLGLVFVVFGVWDPWAAVGSSVLGMAGGALWAWRAGSLSAT
jgi:hypothetical protein